MSEFERDVGVDKPGIVGARWWHKSLVDEGASVQRRDVLAGFVKAGGALAALSLFGCCVSGAIFSSVSDSSGSSTGGSSGTDYSGGGTPETTSIATRKALDMQRQYGWDFGARGVQLVFNGVAEGAFDRAQLASLPQVMTPSATGPNAKYYVAALVESLNAAPLAALPDPQDGSPKPDAAPFRPLSAEILPIVTPSMTAAYTAGQAVARLVGSKPGVAVLADLPGPEGVAFAAGAAGSFEPVLLLDNWPHPQGVVPSHLTLAALAYYQPRFAATKQERTATAPLFVLDRSRLAPYSEQSDRFDNRYYARFPFVDALGKDGVKELFYVVASPTDLPEPDDLNAALTVTPDGSPPAVAVRALALTDFGVDVANALDELPASPPVKEYRFAPRAAPPSPSVGQVAVVVAASGLILAAALDRRGSMNRFAGGWSG